MCLLCSGKYVCPPFKSLKSINPILSCLFPIESKTLYHYVKVFISLDKIFLFISLTCRFHYRKQQNLNFFSAVVQNNKSQISQQGKACILYIYRLQAIKNFRTKIYLK